MGNPFDKIKVNLDEVFTFSRSGHKEVQGLGRRPLLLSRVIKRYFFAGLIFCRVYPLLLNIGAMDYWFREFKTFWLKGLKGRPIMLVDFHWLLSSYRCDFIEVETGRYQSKSEFLKSWQDNSLYMLFNAVRLYAYHPFRFRHVDRYLSSGDHILEYGCGIAPVTFYLSNLSLHQNLRFTIADIRQINFAYAVYRHPSYVENIEIDPEVFDVGNSVYDVIVCMQVFEHLPHPMDTLNALAFALKPRGKLIFDFIAGDGDGQDTIEAVEQRSEILEFIDRNFNWVQKVEDSDGSILFAAVTKNR